MGMRHPTALAAAATVLLFPPALLYWPDTPPSTASWVSAALLAVICTGVAYILYFRLLSRVGPSKTLAVTYLIPVFGVLWGHLFLHEPITASMVVGCAVILIGTTLATGIASIVRRRESGTPTLG